MLLTILALSTTCGLAVALYFVHTDLKAERRKARNYYLNYTALWNEVSTLQAENDAFSHALESLQEDEFARAMGNTPCESEAFKAGYTYDDEGNLVLAEADAIKWSCSQDVCYSDCGDANDY